MDAVQRHGDHQSRERHDQRSTDFEPAPPGVSLQQPIRRTKPCRNEQRYRNREHGPQPG